MCVILEQYLSSSGLSLFKVGSFITEVLMEYSIKLILNAKTEFQSIFRPSK